MIFSGMRIVLTVLFSAYIDIYCQISMLMHFIGPGLWCTQWQCPLRRHAVTASGVVTCNSVKATKNSRSLIYNTLFKIGLCFGA